MMSEREVRQRARNRAQLAALAERSIRRLGVEEALAQADAEVNRDGPLVGEVVWHVHQR